MRSYIRLAGLMTILGILAAAQPPGVTVLSEGRRDFTATATTQAGETLLFVRQIRFDSPLSNGKTGKSVLLLLFEPMSGFVCRRIAWTEKEYPESMSTDSLPPYWRVATAPDRMAFFALIYWELIVTESKVRAPNLEAAEADSWNWAGAHLADIEARRPESPTTTIPLNGPLSTGLPPRSAFPPGFFDDFLRSEVLETPLKWAGVAPNGNGWNLTFEHTKTHQRITIPLIPHGTGWLLGLGQVQK